jgi:hypothetical protein
MLRPTDDGRRQRIVMVHGAPITPDRKLVRRQRSTDAFDHQPDARSDLLCQRPQGNEKRHQKAINRGYINDAK